MNPKATRCARPSEKSSRAWASCGAAVEVEEEEEEEEEVEAEGAGMIGFAGVGLAGAGAGTEGLGEGPTEGFFLDVVRCKGTAVMGFAGAPKPF